jgi:excisionase family DNA binding protein
VFEGLMDAMTNLDSDLLTPTELAQQLRVSRSWVYEAAKAGRIPCVRLGGPDGPVRFVRSDVDAWLELARQGWLPGESAMRTTRRTARAVPAKTTQLRIDAIAGEA